MMKKIELVAGILLGVVFVVFGANFFLKFISMPMPPEGSPPAMFMGAMYLSGYLAFVKILEIIGGILTAIPKTRNLGLLILGPIVINILAFNVFLTKGSGLLQPPVILVTLLSGFLLFSARHRFSQLIR